MFDKSLMGQLESLHSDAFHWAVSCSAGQWDRGADVLQAAYLKVLRGTVTFRGDSAFKTWWLGVVRFTALEEARRARRQYGLIGRYRANLRVNYEARSAGEVGRDEGEFEALEAALIELSARQREVLHLTFFQELSLREAAIVMGVSVGSARQHYGRAKRRLRQLLGVGSTRHE
ncbi:MAG: RNA polymerase sigma factor [Planctomycetaceae bacterium]